ncbi:zinc-binding dehydrogenase [Leifsonia sp. L25]|uniref:zinc-binding dehydrogenase n=1 Tax=Leifsonia sp. L25 TaxID=3423957 RepID=UPI003D68AD7C
MQLAKRAGAYVIATASPRSRAAVLAAGADEVIDHTDTEVVAAVGEPVDVLLNLAPISPDEFRALVGRVRDGGVVVSTTAWMPAPADEERGVRAVDVFVRSDVDQLTELVGLVDRGELTVQVDRRVPLSDLAALHAEAASGALRGKVVVVPGAAAA